MSDSFSLPDPDPSVPPERLPSVPPVARPPQEQMLVTMGDIGVTQSWVVTPSGTRPIGTVTWLFTDMSRTTQSIPAWAIVCAILFSIFFLLGLLFLLAKETRTEGFVQIVVQGPRLVHTTQLPVSSPQQIADYNARVNYARALSASAGSGA
jgi:hypothetical protein